MIEVKNLSLTYPDGTEAIKDLNIIFPREKIFAIMGMSGSGKTSLINCIARFLKPQMGSISIDNHNIYDMDEITFREQIGVVFQGLYLFPHMNVLENMMLAPMRVQNRSRKIAKIDAMEMLNRLKISNLAENYPSQVSGGEAQRVAIARGLMMKPKFMLLDEPTSALDAKTTSDFTTWLLELQSDTTFIIVTHDLPFAQNTAVKGVFMSNGRIVQNGNIDDIVKHLS